MIRKPNAVDLSLILFLVFVWSSAFLAIKVAVPEVGPAWLVTLRVGLGFLVLLPWALWKGLVWPKSGRQWGLVCLIAIFNVIVPFVLISWAELTIDAGVAALLMGTGPFVALIGSHFTTHDDRLTPLKFLAVFLGFAGVLTVVGFDAAKGLGDNVLAQAAALGGSLCYTISGMLIRKVDGIPPTRLSALVLGLATSALVVGTLAFGPSLEMPSTTAVGALIWLGLFPTGLGYILRYHLIRTIGFSYFALGLNLIPVFGVGLAALLLGEVVPLRVVVALVLIVAGLMLARIGVNREARA